MGTKANDLAPAFPDDEGSSSFAGTPSSRRIYMPKPVRPISSQVLQHQSDAEGMLSDGGAAVSDAARSTRRSVREIEGAGSERSVRRRSKKILEGELDGRTASFAGSFEDDDPGVGRPKSSSGRKARERSTGDLSMEFSTARHGRGSARSVSGRPSVITTTATPDHTPSKFHSTGYTRSPYTSSPTVVPPRPVPSPALSATSSVFSNIPSTPVSARSPGGPGYQSFSAVLSGGQKGGPTWMEASKPGHDSAARRWIRWMERTGKKELIVPVLLLGVGYIKFATGLGGWSGKGKPPLFGDMEAQRHWLSLTYHLPPSKWYFHDLQYWGLDYPPITAYVSWIFGFLAHKFGNPAWVALKGGDQERVDESRELGLYMRFTVLATELVIWWPAVVGWTAAVLGGWGVRWRSGSRRSGRTQTIAVLSILLQPALILIDNGHFQYNSVMLGFTLVSIICFHQNRDLLGAVFFVLSLGFKQMALYYSPAVFAYLFGKCLYLGGMEGISLFIRLAITSTATLLIIFSPFLSPPVLLQSIHRIFPFARGLFEDKVANFWCALNTVVKLREVASIPTLTRLALVVTLLALMPSLLWVLWVSWVTRSKGRSAKDTKKPAGESLDEVVATGEARPPPTLVLLPHALLASSLAFFLFSFQVHEKSILLPLLPVTLLMAGKEPGERGRDWEWSVLCNNVGVFSMWPLLRRDEQGLQYVVLTLFWNYVIGYNPFSLQTSFVKLLSLGAYATMLGIHLLELIASPPEHLPDLFVVLNLTLSAGIFGLVWLWSLKRQIQEGWALIGLGLGSGGSSTGRKSSGQSSISAGGRRGEGSVAGSLSGGEERERHPSMAKAAKNPYDPRPRERIPSGYASEGRALEGLKKKTSRGPEDGQLGNEEGNTTWVREHSGDMSSGARKTSSTSRRRPESRQGSGRERGSQSDWEGNRTSSMKGHSSGLARERGQYTAEDL